MLKAVFLDYTGTIIKEGGPDMEKLAMRCYKNSKIESPRKMIAYWWELLKKYETESYGEHYKTEDEIVDQILETCREKIHLQDNLEELHRLCQRFWVHAPAFEDVQEFFAKCPLPIYVISNNGIAYVEEGMKEKGLKPAGIICGDMVRAYKPHRELFEKGLEICKCSPKEVVHIGDSKTSDVEGARSAGIVPIWLDRNDRQNVEEDDIITVHSLQEALEILKRMMLQEGTITDKGI